MKNIFFSAIAMTLVLVSCNQKNKETDNSKTIEKTSELYACPMHPEVQGKKGETCSKCGMELTEPIAKSKVNQNHQMENRSSHKSDKTGITAEIIPNYLNLKNALAKDDSKAAAEFAKSLYNSFQNTKTDKLPDNLKKQFADIVDDAKEHAEHIGSSESKIEHQREHFVILSNDIRDLIELVGANQKLYLEYCPMADNNKGAVWISETKEISNPYFGNDMATCGSVQKEY